MFVKISVLVWASSNPMGQVQNTLRLPLVQVTVSFLFLRIYEMSRIIRKADFYLCKNKDADQLCSNCTAVTAQLISAFVFATWMVQFLLYLYPKFQYSSFLLWVYRPVCVGPGRKSQRLVFSRPGLNGLEGKPDFGFCPSTLRVMVLNNAK